MVHIENNCQITVLILLCLQISHLKTDMCKGNKEFLSIGKCTTNSSVKSFCNHIFFFAIFSFEDNFLSQWTVSGNMVSLSRFRDSGSHLSTVGVSLLPTRFLPQIARLHSPQRDVKNGQVAQNQGFHANEAYKWALRVQPVIFPSYTFLPSIFNLCSTPRR